MSDYGWIHGSDCLWAGGGGIALIEGGDVEATLDLLAPAAETEVLSHPIFERIHEFPDGKCPVLAKPRGEWTLLVTSVYDLAPRQTMEQLSRDGRRAFAIACNVNMHMAFVGAENGQVIRHFDPFDYYDEGTVGGGLGYGGAAEGVPYPEETASPPLPEDALPLAHELLERLTGVVLTKADISDEIGASFRYMDTP